MSPVEPRDAPQWRPGAGNSRNRQEQQPWAGEDGRFLHSLLWRLLVWGSWSLEELASLLKCNNYFDFTLDVASHLLSFVYLDSFI